MNLVLRLNKDDELFLINEQKKILKNINLKEEKNIAFPFFPLLCNLKNDYFINKSISDLKKAFYTIQLKNAVLSEQKIIIPVLIKTNENFEISEELVIGTLKKDAQNYSSNKDEKNSENILKNIRVFILANAQKNKNITELKDATFCRCTFSA